MMPERIDVGFPKAGDLEVGIKRFLLGTLLGVIKTHPTFAAMSLNALDQSL